VDCGRDVGRRGVGSADRASPRTERQPGFHLAPTISERTAVWLGYGAFVTRQSNYREFAGIDSSVGRSSRSWSAGTIYIQLRNSPPVTVTFVITIH
jgi:hypothetical protein